MIYLLKMPLFMVSVNHPAAAVSQQHHCFIQVLPVPGDLDAGRLDPGDIDEDMISRHLYTAGLPDPDLLIRTAGELRVSNYLLWQISYAEIHVTDVFWPDFRVADLHVALRDYASRCRRFGGVDHTNA